MRTVTAEVLHGARTTTSWLQGALHLAPGEASTHVKLARATRDVAQLRREMTCRNGQGDQRSPRRHRTVTSTASIAKLRPRQPNYSAILRQLVDAGRLRTAGRALQHAVDPDGALRECEKQFERRYLQLSPMLDGMVARRWASGPGGCRGSRRRAGSIPRPDW